MTDLREMGICERWGEPHAKESACISWHPVEVPTAPKVNVVEQSFGVLGIWHEGKFITVDLGALGTMISLKDIQIRELQDWKESAISVTPNWQRIGVEMGLSVGADVAANLLPYIQNMKIALEKEAEIGNQETRRCDRLIAEIKKLEFQVQDEKAIGNRATKLLAECQASAASAQMFGTHCVCKWQGGKVMSLCGAHQEAVDAGKKWVTDRLAKGLRKLEEGL